MFEAFIAHTVATTGFEITLTQEKIYERLEGNATNFDCSRIFFIYLFILNPSVQFWKLTKSYPKEILNLWTVSTSHSI